LNSSTFDPGFLKLGDGDPSFVNTTDGTQIPAARDYDLTSDTIAIANALSGNPTTVSGGAPIAGLTVDFLGREVPSPATGNTDIGAFQYSSSATVDAGSAPPPGNGGSGGASSAGGSSTGGSSAGGSSSGGTSPGGSPTGGSSGGASHGASGVAAGCSCGVGGQQSEWVLVGVLVSIASVCAVRRRRSRKHSSNEEGIR
jgi:MYXO-CTERM domain-containing protein